MERLPVVLLTGFLGAGKTTLLNTMLRAPQMRDTAVLVNEFGEVGIDQALIQLAGAEVVLLENGCICCSIREGLAATLLDLADKRDRGAVPPFARVVIETTGLADPFPIIGLLVDDALVAQRYGLQLVLTVVDAPRALACLEAQSEAASQVAGADAVWFSKCDVATPEQVAAANEAVRVLNRSATLFAPGARALDELLQTCGAPLHEAGTPRRLGWQRLARTEHGLDCVCCERAPRLPGVARHAIQSCCVVRPKPMQWALVGPWLESVMQAHGDALLRIKGIVCIEGDEQKPWVIQGVQASLAAPEPLPAWPSAERISKLVFIGRGLQSEAIEAALVELEAARAAC